MKHQNIEEIYKKPWDFILYKKDKKYILQVTFCEQSVDFSIFYSLTNNDIDNINNIEYFSNLSNDIRKNKDKYANRKILDINNY